MIIRRFECSVIVVVVFARARKNRAIGVKPVFGHHDRRLRVSLAESPHERFHPLGDLGGRHVRKAVEHVDSRVKLGQQRRHLGLHSAASRESEVDDRAVEPPAQNRGMDHPRA